MYEVYMCTIITVSSNAISDEELFDRIDKDATYNDDGWSMLMVLASGKPMFMQTLDLDAVYSAVLDMNWKRLFLHARAATQGSTRLDNCHGWNSDGTYVFHNGILRNPQSTDFPVDSQLIQWWLDRYGLGKTLNLLRTEDYANVMLVDTVRNEYTIHRSSVGGLYTDGLGNYSTNAVGNINQKVGLYSNETHDLGLQLAPLRKTGQWWDTEYDDEKIDWSRVVALPKAGGKNG